MMTGLHSARRVVDCIARPKIPLPRPLSTSRGETSPITMRTIRYTHQSIFLKHIRFSLSLLVILCVILPGCGDTANDPTDTEAVIQQKFAERVALLVGNIQNKCREEALAIAEDRADSLLLDRAGRRKRLDGRPPRPVRPGRPVVRELSEPLPLRPLFPFEIRFDTLLRDSLLLDSLVRDSVLRGLREGDVNGTDLN